jgi:uncharacterized protein YndB with AHSA1/START domain
MTVTTVDKNPTARTLCITAEYDAPVERVWQLWADPRLLERWWGPPTYPATFEAFDLAPGGKISYYMTGPEGDQPHGWWKVLAVDPPNRIEIEDGFASEHGVPDPNMPIMHMRVDITERDGGSRMAITTTFASEEAMAKILEMGMEEGMSEAIGQIDGILAELAARA